MARKTVQTKTDIVRKHEYFVSDFRTGESTQGRNFRSIVVGKVIDYNDQISTVTPSYRRRRKTGTLPENGLSIVRFSVKGTKGRCNLTLRNGFGQQVDVFEFSAPACSEAVVPTRTLPFSALDHLLLKLARDQEWNASVFFAEARKTSAMVVNRAEHLVKMLYYLRKGDFLSFYRSFKPATLAKRPLPERELRRRQEAYQVNHGRNAREAAGGAWLEYSYGWRPFLKDVHDAFATLGDLMDQPETHIHRLRVKKKVRRYEALKDVLLFQHSESGLHIYGNIDTSEEESIRAVWRFMPNLYDLPAKLGLTNPLLVLHEVTPLSFVADWFLPIGEYLQNLDSDIRFAHHGGSYGYMGKTHSVRQPLRSPSHRGSWSGFQGSSKYLAIQRFPMLNPPSMDFGDLFISPNLGSGQVLSSIALLQQSVKQLRLPASLGGAKTRSPRGDFLPW